MMNKVLNYCKNHMFQCIAVILVLIAAFGFYASNYSYHYDVLADDYYSGTVLIGAGRIFAPLLSFFTNWMTFAPFWHTLVMGIILFFSGLLFGLIFQKASGNKLSDNALFVFWIIFATFPIIMYQLTFPILSVVLPYLFIGIAVYKMLPVFSNQKINKATILLIVALLTISIDMYESHAAVFLTTFFAAYFIYLIYSNEKEKIKHFLKISIIIITLLIVAIVSDFIISKLFCRLCCGTFDFWYSGNTNIAWLEESFIDGIKWLIRELIARYLICSASNYSVLIYDICLFAGLIIALVIAKKKKSYIILLVYICCAVATMALAIVIGSAPLYRMMQTLPIFVAVIFMLFYGFVEKKDIIKKITTCILVVIVMNQTLYINRYSVANYERYQYEDNILTNVAMDLSEYPIHDKEVLFIYDENWDFPDFENTPLDLNNPILNIFKNFLYNIFDTIIPNTTYKRLNSRYENTYPGESYSLLNAEGVDAFFNKQFKIQIYVPFNVKYQDRFYLPESYAAFSKAGYTLIPAREAISNDTELYDEICSEYLSMPTYPQEGYIIETQDKIIVKIY